MYLIHVQLRPPTAGSPLPDGIAGLVHAAAAEEDRLEHVAVHAAAEPDPVIGLYLIADRLAEAESRAAVLCRRVLSAAALHGWSVSRAAAPLVAPFLEAELARSGRGGRIRPGTLPSS
ncbi:hypothetical protein [Kitasatospora sp. NPDC059571]|uniref:hypothetical protein n=1 Tax=Kitasatospora sp. NPDC059571 TaxID=3346871 RepID=UPI0036A900BB